MSKPRVVKDYDKLDIEIQEQIKLHYPHGFHKHLVTFKNIKGEFVSALPFEAEEKYYLVRMTKQEARDIIEEDDDFNDDGILKKAVVEDLQSKYELDMELDDEMADDDIDDGFDDVEDLPDESDMDDDH